LDVMLLDLGLPDMDGLQLLRRLHERAPELAVVVLTMHAEEEYVLRALAVGAGGYVLKLAEPEAVVEAIGRAVKGELYLDPAVAGPVTRRAVQPAKADPLTVREREVLKCIARGLTNRQIAEELFVSLNTVETIAATSWKSSGPTPAPSWWPRPWSVACLVTTPSPP
jgi:DNA-binding NarL/FixJ family response regulator